MRRNLFIPILMFIGGLTLVITAVATGEAEVSLVLVFPVFSGSSWLFVLGVLLVVASFLVGFAMMATGQPGGEPDQPTPSVASQARQGVGKAEYGGVILIGPVPIAFGSSRTIAIVMLAIGVAMTVLVLGLILAL